MIGTSMSLCAVEAPRRRLHPTGRDLPSNRQDANDQRESYQITDLHAR
jgi:hypothetical protein